MAGESSLPVVCRGCNRTVRMEQVKFDETRKAYVCGACYASSHPSSVKTPQRPNMANSSSQAQEEKNIKALKDSLVKYNCQKCKYHFTRAKEKGVSSCPYCGSNKIEIASGHTADKIIADSDRYNF